METNSMQMIPDGGTTRHVFAMNSLFVRKCTFYSSQVVPVVATKPRHGFLGILQSIVILRSHRQPHYFPPELFHPTLAMRHDDATLTQPLLWLCMGSQSRYGESLVAFFLPADSTRNDDQDHDEMHFCWSNIYIHWIRCFPCTSEGSQRVVKVGDLTPSVELNSSKLPISVEPVSLAAFYPLGSPPIEPCQ